MSVKRKQHANVADANARTHGEAMNVAVAEACFTSENTTFASVDNFTHHSSYVLK